MLALLICTTRALLLPNLPFLSNFTSDLFNGSIGINDNSSTTRLGAGRVQKCQSSFGRDLNVESCSSALRQIPLSLERQVYAPRNAGVPQSVSLPQWILSEDGLCAIDISLGKGGRIRTVDSSSNCDIHAAVLKLLSDCTIARGLGGFVKGFSEWSRVSIHCTPTECSIYGFGLSKEVGRQFLRPVSVRTKWSNR